MTEGGDQHKRRRAVVRVSMVAAVVCLALLSVSCGADDDASPKTVSISPNGGVSWTTDTVTYAKGLSHDGEFNAGGGEEVDLVGDLYEPEVDGGLRPALLIVHGGGFLFGERDQAELVDLAEYFAARGWVVFSIDYRLANQYGTAPQAWIDAIERERDGRLAVFRGKAMYAATRDAKAAVRFLQANASEYDISAAHIAVMGGSAGAQIAVALGVTEPGDFRDELTLEDDPTLASANLDESGEVAAVVDFWGGTDVVDARDDAFGGELRWDAGDAPVLIVHGTEDSVVPFEQAERIRERYQASGVAYEFVRLEGEGHAAWDARVDERSLAEVAHRFLREQLGL